MKLSIWYFIVILILFKLSISQILDTYYLPNRDDPKCKFLSYNLISRERERSLTDFTIFTTALNHGKDLNPMLFICDYDYVVPNGRFIDHDGVSFYFPRLRISRLKCGQELIIFGGQNSDSLFKTFMDISSQKFIFTCSNTPVIFNSEYRFLRFFWQSKPSIESNVTIELTNYVRFSNNYSIPQQREKCLFRQKFWCANLTDICLTNRAVCNGFDDCFDGGSDEIEKCMRHNHTIRHEHSTSWAGWPWVALILLPIILVCALARICSQKRQLDIDEDYEYKRSYDSSDDQEDDSCDLHLNEEQPSTGMLDGIETEGRVLPSAPTVDSVAVEAGYVYPYGPPMSISAEYCHSEEKASTSNWKDEKCDYLHLNVDEDSDCQAEVVDRDKEEISSHPPTPPPRYDESMMYLTSSSRFSFPTAPAYGQNIYVISPDTSMVVAPPRKQQQLTMMQHVGGGVSASKKAVANVNDNQLAYSSLSVSSTNAHFQLEVCAQVTSFTEESEESETQEGTSLLLTNASMESRSRTSSSKALLSEEEEEDSSYLEEKEKVNGSMEWKSTLASKEKSESFIEMESMTTKPILHGTLPSNVIHSSNNGERDSNSTDKTASSYENHYVLV